MKNILFMTDLDGTLLTSGKEISQKSADILNGLIKRGLKFAISTARTPATLEKILSPLDIRLPVCCMNGAAFYDMKKEKYVKYFTLGDETVKRLITAGRQAELSPFIHSVKDNFLTVSFENTESEPARLFYEERRGLRLKRHIKAPYDKKFGSAIYFTFLGKEDKIREVTALIRKERLESLVSLNCYRDIYSDGYFFLEISDRQASKKTGLFYLKELSRADFVYAFGDNLNDLPMLEAADRAYAVENAAEEVKKFCHFIIGKNDCDSVAGEICRLQKTVDNLADNVII